jgi:cytochrome c oxidase subunit 4
MENTQTPGAAHSEPAFSTKPIWRTFWILLGITLVELTLATIHLKTGFPPKYVLNGVYLILTLAKAFYIIAEFMHLGHELKNLIMSLAFPAMLFIWFLIAFLWDGNSFKVLRNKYDSHHLEQSHTPAAKPAEGAEPANKPGAAE